MGTRSLLAALLVTACSNVPLVPFTSQDATVTQVTRHGPYLDTRLKGSGFDLRFMFPNDEACREVLRAETQVSYRADGPFGEVEPAEGDTCVPAGIADLDTWRARKPRPDARLAPSAQAKFREVFRDSEVILVRGSFPLATRVSMAGALDLVAMLPATPECSTVTQRGIATMIYRDTGRDAFRLLIDPGKCPVLGFAQPTRELRNKEKDKD